MAIIICVGIVGLSFYIVVSKYCYHMPFKLYGLLEYKMAI